MVDNPLPPPEPAKPIGESKTVWVALATAVVSLLGGTVGQELISEHPGWTAVIGVVVAVAMVYLRIVTDRPVDSGKIIQLLKGER